MIFCYHQASIGRLAQLVRAPRLHRGGHMFESCSVQSTCHNLPEWVWSTSFPLMPVDVRAGAGGRIPDAPHISTHLRAQASFVPMAACSTRRRGPVAPISPLVAYVMLPPAPARPSTGVSRHKRRSAHSGGIFNTIDYASSPDFQITIPLTVNGRTRKFHPWEGWKAQRSASACERKCNAM